MQNYKVCFIGKIKRFFVSVNPSILKATIRFIYVHRYDFKCWSNPSTERETYNVYYKADIERDYLTTWSSVMKIVY